MDIQYSWNPCCEQANWERKECRQLEGSEEQVVEEEEEPEEQMVKEVLWAQAELAVEALVWVAMH